MLKKSLPLIIGIIIGILIVWIYEFFNSQKQIHSKQLWNEKLNLVQQTEMIESKKNNALLSEMNSVVNQMNVELNHDSKGILSDATIGRLAALSYSFTPYYHVEGDSISHRKICPERGLLLLEIACMKMDSGSFKKMMGQCIFSYAYLKKADLKNANLEGINLQYATLREANLEGANLNHSNLRDADLWGVNLKQATLNNSDLTLADLSWGDMNGANFVKANLTKALVKSAQMKKCDLSNAIMVRADFTGTFLNESTLRKSNMLSTILVRVNLSGANLTEAILTTAPLTEAILNDANFERATLSKCGLTNTVVGSADWLTQLTQWKVTGAEGILNQYQLVSDTVEHKPHFYLSNRVK
ncbi:MAG TPA: hypothetical protein DCQ93_08715 [Bacteroidetes bacterium]|nr:hypothetical protein [Bacteroidota bacterium]